MSRCVRPGVRALSAVVVAVVVSLGTAAPLGAQTTVVLNSTSTTSSVSIRGGQYASTNYDRQILTTRASDNPDYLRRSLLKFDTSESIPANAVVQSAVLTLTVKGGYSATRRLGLYSLTTPFDTSAATWKRRKSGLDWSRAGGDLGAKYAEATVTGTPGSKVSFDVTGLVQRAVSGKLESRWTRVAIVDLGGSTVDSYREYYPVEAADASVRPTLRVVHGGPSKSSSSASSSGSSSSGKSSPSPPAAGTVPSGWATRDVGNVGVTGSAAHAGGRYTVSGAGRDIWDAADGFHFVHRTLTGDGEIVARVESIQQVDAWTKAGVMMRETLNPGSRHAFMLVSSGKGLAFQRRTGANGLSSHTTGGTGRTPHWVRLKRSGDTFTAYRSTDGSNWTKVGSQTIPMTATINVGLAVTSHAHGRLAAATFTDVAVKAIAAATPPPSSSSSSSSSSKTFRLLHWNTRHGGRGTDDKYDPARLVSWIVKMNPDVASLNEVGNSSHLNALLKELKKQTGATWNHHWDTRGNVLVTRHAVTYQSVCWVNSSAGRRATLIGVVINGRPISIWSAHLDAESGSVRTSEVKALKSCAAQFPEQRIVAGDFNAQPGSAEMAEMGKGYADAWAKANASGTATDMPGNAKAGATRNSRIDYVFTSSGATRLELTSARIVDTRDAKGHMPSDHKPLLVTYAVR